MKIEPSNAVFYTLDHEYPFILSYHQTLFEFMAHEFKEMWSLQMIHKNDLRDLSED